MDEVLVYLAFGAIYLVSRYLKAQKQKRMAQGAPVEEYTQDEPVEPSFEDLIRQFTQPKTAPAPEPERPAPPPPVRKIPKRAQYEVPAIELKEEEKFEHFDAYSVHSFTNPYAEMLNDPEELKKAIIMTEILKRKF